MTKRVKVLRGLSLIRWGTSDGIESQKKKAPANLLDYLQPVGPEERVARSCADVIGVNLPRARLMLDAQGWLLRFAEAE